MVAEVRKDPEENAGFSGNRKFIIWVQCFIQNEYDGEYYLAVKIENGFFSASNIYYEWNRFENRLYLKTSTDTEFVFIVGSDICTINGKEEKLDKPFYLFDKLPVLPLKFLLDKAGLKYSVSDSGIDIKVRQLKRLIIQKGLWFESLAVCQIKPMQ